MPHGTAENEYMHESIEKDAVKFDLDTDQIIAALCYDNEELQAENIKLKAELEKHRWIPVTERLPELVFGAPRQYSLDVWVYCENGCGVTKGYYDAEGWTIYSAHGSQNFFQGTITHWKPIILPK